MSQDTRLLLLARELLSQYSVVVDRSFAHFTFTVNNTCSSVNTLHRSNCFDRVTQPSTRASLFWMPPAFPSTERLPNAVHTITKGIGGEGDFHRVC